MLTTQQKTLRKFWYATMPVSYLTEGPKPFRLMNEDIVLFLDADGNAAALRDRCCHRTAKLSKGWMDEGNIVCGYHGWTYDRTGKVVRVPQYDPSLAPPRYKVDSYYCQARYGYVWVALEEPLLPLFDIPEDGAPGFRRIFQFYDQWQTGPLRLMENSFDNAQQVRDRGNRLRLCCHDGRGHRQSAGRLSGHGNDRTNDDPDYAESLVFAVLAADGHDISERHPPYHHQLCDADR